MRKEKFKTFCSVLQIFCKQIMDLLIYGALIIMINHSKTTDQNSVRSLTSPPHLTKYTHTITKQRKVLINLVGKNFICIGSKDGQIWE